MKKRLADSLATLASSVAGPGMESIPIEEVRRLPFKQESTLQGQGQVCSAEIPNWMTPCVKYLREGKLPEDKKATKRIRYRAGMMTLLDGQVYRQTPDGVMLRCVGKVDVAHILEEIHS